MVKPDDLSKPPVAFEHDSTLVAVLEMSGRAWLAAAIVPGLDRRPLRKLPVDEHRPFRLLERWRGAAGVLNSMLELGRPEYVRIA